MMQRPLTWTEINPTLELELERRRFGDADPRGPLPLSLLEELDTRHGAQKNATFLDAWQSLAVTQVRPETYQRALELADELELEAPAYLDRCRVRHAVADYLERELVPYASAHGDDPGEYGRLAWQLRDARHIGAYGVDVDGDDGNGELCDVWANRAGLVKLCPDDARREAQRASKLYGRRLEELDAAGYVLRSAVFTLPNFPQWHLAAGLDSIYERFKQTVLYARTDGKVARSIRDAKRKFPDLVGAWSCLEAPLSGRFVDGDALNAWNVHLNLLLVFKPSEELVSFRTVNGRAVPDYSPIHDAWGAGIHWREIPQGDRDAMRHALLELVKYPLQTVATKSAKDRPRKFAADGSELTPAPPMIEWPAECFAEWWRAHKGFRRARSWGMLYRGALVDDEPKRRAEWFGVIRLSPAGVDVERPRLSTRELERQARLREFAHKALKSTDPGYRITVAKRDAVARERFWNAGRLDDARERLFLIQGNKSAGPDVAATVVGAFRAQKTGPPGTG